MNIRDTKREKVKKYNYVYKLTFKYDRRYFYIGKRSTNNDDDSEYLGSGMALKEYKEQYGKYCFEKEILSFWNTADEALNEEARIVTKDLIKNEFCLNRMTGGGGFDATGCIRGKSSPEAIKKNSESHKGLKQTEETKEKRAKSIRLKWQNKEYRENQQKGREGKYVEHLEKLRNERVGKICLIKDGHWKYVTKEDSEVLLKDGWKTRGVENKPSYEQILEYRKNGMSYAKIGAIYGVNESCVRRWRKKYENDTKGEGEDD